MYGVYATHSISGFTLLGLYKNEDKAYEFAADLILKRKNNYDQMKEEVIKRIKENGGQYMTGERCPNFGMGCDMMETYIVVPISTDFDI